ncbi:hypothetical protein CTI12_AA533210 [Artemisia annua]|uniref:Uncharacterized protein n=1 Tax=Artemisia annua TaxID=35608 RepID=A0A2U1L405_ARTAN|nr:hypothetical protein CTI12_AA533210 [Artemisia annua]
MKSIFVILVAIVMFLVFLEANASRPNFAFPIHDWSMGKNAITQHDAKKTTTTMARKEANNSGMTESDGQENDSSTDTHHYFPCVEPSKCGNIRT